MDTRLAEETARIEVKIRKVQAMIGYRIGQWRKLPRPRGLAQAIRWLEATARDFRRLEDLPALPPGVVEPECVGRYLEVVRSARDRVTAYVEAERYLGPETDEARPP